MQVVEVSWTRDVAEARELARLVQARRRRGVVRLRALCVLVLLLALVAPFASPARVTLGFAAAMTLLFALALPRLAPAMVPFNRRAWSVGVRITVRLTPEGGRHIGPFGVSDYAWGPLRLER